MRHVCQRTLSQILRSCTVLWKCAEGVPTISDKTAGGCKGQKESISHQRQTGIQTAINSNHRLNIEVRSICN